MKIYTSILICTFFLVTACSKNDAAQKHLEAARLFYASALYDSAKVELDSIKALYPKAFQQQQEAFRLMDSIRYAENVRDIILYDSLINKFQPVLDSLKKHFIYQINKDYQDEGTYIPKEIASEPTLSKTTLRSGVKENGQIFIETVFIGNQVHNKIKVATKDGSFAESQAVDDDGLNFRFTNLGKQFEVINFSGAAENGISQFIFAHADVPLTLTLDGANRFSHPLSETIKKAITKSYQLSIAILQIDSLKTEKEKAEYKLNYLKNKGKSDINTTDSITTIE